MSDVFLLMRGRGRALASLLVLSGCLLAAVGCTSSKDLETIGGQLSEIQRQILQLQRQSPTTDDLAAIAAEAQTQRQALLDAKGNQDLRLDELTAVVERLKSRLDETIYRLAQLSQQLAATNQELKAARTTAQSFGGGRGADRPSAQASGQDPENLYRSAYNDYLRGNYELAIQQFQEYIAAFAETDLADNAAYWLGECYYRQSKYRLAIGEFDTLLTRYPRSDKIPSALLKKGYAYLELSERNQGIVQLQHVIREYAGSDESNLAQQRLRELGVDGG